VLRGFDLFCLIMLCPFLHAFNWTGEYGWLQPVMKQFNHVAWEGFVFWDLVMPLFMFMAGVSIPFAFSKYIGEGKGHAILYRRIFRRVVSLWILGMVCQGNLLAFNAEYLKLFSNTLQAIAVGYLIASVVFLHLNPRGQIGVAAGLLLLYWGLMSFVTVQGHGGGDFSASGNLAEWIDRLVLGHWRDGAYIGETGDVVFPAWYNYTWILSSLNFGVTVMTGLFAGEILKNDWSGIRKIKWMFFIGLAMIIAGWLWGIQMPVIKRIWTSSMVLVSSGYCFWLMLLFYYIIDYKGYTKGWTWLKIIGMNSIAAYLLSSEVGVIDFSCLGHSLFYGLKQYMGEEFYSLLIACSNLTIIYLILYFLYKHRLFLKV
ncbi:MAG: DUF5009 domain-containing protein, partial [Odoribacter sp.]|nr:DUF5009 domain-containing protein [Odoribacter sp.]